MLDNVLHDLSGPDYQPDAYEGPQEISEVPQAYENDATVALTYTVTDADGDSVNGTFNITIDDDIPVSTGAENVVLANVATQSTNLILTLAISGSMADHVNDQGTKLDIAKQGLEDMIEKY